MTSGDNVMAHVDSKASFMLFWNMKWNFSDHRQEVYNQSGNQSINL